MNLRAPVSTLLASKVRIALVAVLLVGASIGGAFAVGILGVPGIAGMDNTFGDVTNETTTIETDLVVSNPNPIGVATQDITVNYTISMNSIEMAQGERSGIAIESGNSTLDLETRMRNEAIPPWWTSHIENDETTLIEVDATLTSDRLGRSTDVSRPHEINTDLIGAFNSNDTRPINADSSLVNDPVLYVNETRGEWGAVSDSETPIDMEFVVYNPNLEPYAITELGYEITMNDVEMGEGETHRTYVIPSETSETIALTTTLRNEHLDEWWVTHLDEAVHGHQVSDLRIEFYAIVELPGGETVTVPLDQLTYEETIGTDIFDEGGDVGIPSESADGSTETEDDSESGGEDDTNGGDDTADDDETEDDGTEDGTEEDEEGDDGDDDEGDDGILPL